MDKLEYISKMLTKISHKRLESYVIHRIWNGLNRTDVRFDFQQYVRRKDGNYALADLYLPQLNISVEVNEPAHFFNIEDDQKRRSEVCSHGVKVFNVDCYNVVNGRPIECTLEELNQRVDLVIDEIKAEIDNRIDSDNFIPWEMHNDIVKTLRHRRVLRVKDYISVNTIDETAQIFGATPKHRGFLRTGGVDIPGETRWIVWWPNTKSSVWTNEISPDENEIRESKNNSKDNSQHLNDCLNQHRVTFIKDKDWLGNTSYRFIGVFELDKNRSVSENKCVWIRTSEEYALPSHKDYTLVDNIPQELCQDKTVKDILDFIQRHNLKVEFHTIVANEELKEYANVAFQDIPDIESRLIYPYLYIKFLKWNKQFCLKRITKDLKDLEELKPDACRVNGFFQACPTISSMISAMLDWENLTKGVNFKNAIPLDESFTWYGGVTGTIFHYLEGEKDPRDLA